MTGGQNFLSEKNITENNQKSLYFGKKWGISNKRKMTEIN